MPVEFDGKRYEQTSTHQKEWGTRLIQELNLRGNEHILDVGCGDGTLTAKLADIVPDGSVSGIDASEGMIRASQLHKKGNLTFKQLDVTKMHFHEKFDVIFSNATLHWIKDHKVLLELLYKALKPSGVLRANFAGDGNCATFNGIVKKVMDQNEFRDAFKGFEWPWYMPGVEEYIGLVKRSPFKNIEVWGENADRYFPDENAMLGWIDQPSIVPFKQFLSPNLAEEFYRIVADLMVKATKQSDGTCFEMFRRINVMAKK